MASRQPKKSNKGKLIKDEFSPQQPGQINVAGEVFFLNLPADSSTDITSRLFSDQIKGDNAFQFLFLGGLPSEEKAGAPFTRADQQNLRRIFRAIFGVTMGPGKRGISLPCDKKDAELMVKALEYRRKVLVQTIANYDQLGATDMHASYLREHLSRLNTLLYDEIPKTRADCRYTGILDPSAPRPLELNDSRMERLLEIFAFLLAQGKDPLAALAKENPKPVDIITRMAVDGAPDIEDYEEEYKRTHNGETPSYSLPLLKLRGAIRGDAMLSLRQIEEFLGLPPENRDLSEADRVKAIDEKLKSIKLGEGETASRIQELSDLKLTLAKKETELSTLTAEKTKCETELKDLKEKLGNSTSAEETAKLQAKVDELTKKLDACEAEKQKLQSSISSSTEDLQKKLQDAEANLEKMKTKVGELEVQLQETQKRLDNGNTHLLKQLYYFIEIAKALGLDTEKYENLPVTDQGIPITPPEEFLKLIKKTLNDRLATTTDSVEQEEYSGLLAEVQSLRDSLQERETQLSEMTKKRDTLQKQLEELNRLAGEGGVQGLLAKYTTLQADLDSAKKALTTAELEKETAERNLDEKIRQIAELERQLSERVGPNEVIDGLRAELAAAIQARDEAIATARASFDEMVRQKDDAIRLAQQEADRYRDSNLEAEQSLQSEMAKSTAYARIISLLNTFLTSQSIPFQIDETRPDDSTNKVIAELGKKFSRPGPPVAAPQAGPGLSICLLNLIYSLFKKLLSERGFREATQNPTWVDLFKQVEKKALTIEATDRSQGNTNLDESILRFFRLMLENYKNLPVPPLESQFLQGVGDASPRIPRNVFERDYDAILALLKTDPSFTPDSEFYSNYLLRGFLQPDKLYNQYEIFRDTKIQVKADPEAGSLRFSSILLLVLSLTKKILKEFGPQLDRYGCKLPEEGASSR